MLLTPAKFTPGKPNRAKSNDWLIELLKSNPIEPSHAIGFYIEFGNRTQSNSHKKYIYIRLIQRSIEFDSVRLRSIEFT